MKKKPMMTATLLFIALLALSWIFNGTGVIKNDPQRNIYIPETLLVPLQVKAAYNGDKMFFRYRWPSDKPHIYHDMLRYDGQKWVRHGGSTVGPQPEGIYEDRLTMLVDDGSVPAFEKYGGYITVGDRIRFFTNAATKKEVQSQPYLASKKQKHVGKYLPQTRTRSDDWSSLVSVEKLKALREAGYFLDLWHWRAHRSNPIDKSDDQYVAEARYGDAGKGVFFTNWDKKKRQPKLMFDAARTGINKLNWDDLTGAKLGFDDIYYLREDRSRAFDPNYPWKEGDTIPRRVLRPGAGSRSDISVVGKARWKDGYWDVTLVRAMDTGNPADDKMFIPNRVYSVAFAVHRDATGSRWHYVSLPVRLGLDREAELRATRFNGQVPEWSQPWYDTTLFYPGQVNWPLLVGKRHAGAANIKQGVPVRYRHNARQLALYGVEMEFNREIIKQWWLTLVAGLLLILSFGFAIYKLSDDNGRN